MSAARYRGPSLPLPTWLAGALTGAWLCLAPLAASAQSGASPPPSEDKTATEKQVAASGQAGEPAAAGGEGEPAADSEVEMPLKVLVAGSPPFVRTDSAGEPAGPSVEVWRRAARQLDWRFDTVMVESVDDAVAQVAAGAADVAIGPISITAERARQVAFSQPYFRSSLGIAAKEQNTFWQRVRPFLSAAFLTAVGALLFVLSIVGSLMWLTEHRKNPEEFPAHPLTGIGNGIWFALVTMTTVGYGDRSPKTVLGRIIAGAWMLVALITVSSLTAGIATALTLSQLGPTGIEKAGDLEDKVVVTLSGTLAERFARAQGARVVPAETVVDALEAVERGDADAVVFDRPGLVHALDDFDDSSLALSPRRYAEQGYGFALPLDSPLRSRLDVALLDRSRDNDALFESFQGNGD